MGTVGAESDHPRWATQKQNLIIWSRHKQVLNLIICSSHPQAQNLIIQIWQRRRRI